MIFAYSKASYVFLKVLFRPADPVVSWCKRGHSQLKGWSHCPDCRWIEAALNKRTLKEKIKSKIYLYCFKGSHLGELIGLGGNEETLGPCIENSKVLSPSWNDAGYFSNESIRVTFRDTPVALSDSTLSFKLNGQEKWKDLLLDYDEIEIFDNQFLVLDFQSFAENALISESGQ